MKKYLYILFLTGFFFLAKPMPIMAQVDQQTILKNCYANCTNNNAGSSCYEICNRSYSDEVGVGQIAPPPGTTEYNTKAGQSIAIVFFISNLLKLATVVAGLWSLVNFILAGFKFLTGQGDPGAMSKVINKITMSVLGLILIIIAYTATAVIGLLLFGKADIFLNPQIPGPTP